MCQDCLFKFHQEKHDNLADLKIVENKLLTSWQKGNLKSLKLDFFWINTTASHDGTEWKLKSGPFPCLSEQVPFANKSVFTSVLHCISILINSILNFYKKLIGLWLEKFAGKDFQFLINPFSLCSLISSFYEYLFQRKIVSILSLFSLVLVGQIEIHERELDLLSS